MTLQLLIQGQDPDAAVKALSELFADGEGDITIEAAANSDIPEELRKTVDPVAVGALILSIPSAALAALDIADRIAKRRRAAELVERAKSLRAGGTVVHVIVANGPMPLHGLGPDELLEAASEEDPQRGP